MNKKSLSELTMLLPPIETQQEIIATLDKIYRKKEEAQEIINQTENLANEQLQNILSRFNNIT